MSIAFADKLVVDEDIPGQHIPQQSVILVSLRYVSHQGNSLACDKLTVPLRCSPRAEVALLGGIHANVADRVDHPFDVDVDCVTVDNGNYPSGLTQSVLWDAA